MEVRSSGSAQEQEYYGVWTIPLEMSSPLAEGEIAEGAIVTEMIIMKNVTERNVMTRMKMRW